MKGYIQVYTGDGKGKTTAALGMAMRSAGHGLKVCIIQFIKGAFTGDWNSAWDGVKKVFKGSRAPQGARGLKCLVVILSRRIVRRAPQGARGLK